jgi:hypothetical protein
LKKAIEANDTDGMKSGMERLNAAVQAISADLYAQARAAGAGAQSGPAGDAGPAASSPGPGPQEGGDKGVIDADFEMKK